MFISAQQVDELYQEIAPQAFPSVPRRFAPRNDISVRFTVGEGLGPPFYCATMLFREGQDPPLQIIKKFSGIIENCPTLWYKIMLKEYLLLLFKGD